MADDRTYIKVHDGIEDHPKIVALSDKAFRVLVTTWGWSSRHTTDGFITDAVWRKRASAKVRKELEAQMVHGTGHDCPNCPEVPPGHVRMHDYLEHQRSAEQIDERKEAKKRASAVGNHMRWHVALKKYDPTCPHCVANGSHVGSQPGSHAPSQKDPDSGPHGIPKPSTDTETDTETEKRRGGHLPAQPPDRAHDKPPPPRCPKHINEPTTSPCRPCGDARQAHEHWETQQKTARQKAIRACRLCDIDGWRYERGRRIPITPYVRCDHQPHEHQEPA